KFDTPGRSAGSEPISQPRQALSAERNIAESGAAKATAEAGTTEPKTAYPSHKCVHELVADRAEQSPDALAVVHGERQLTFRELNERANQLADYLRRKGVGKDVPVGICLKRSVELTVALLGVMKAGGACLPLDP